MTTRAVLQALYRSEEDYQPYLAESREAKRRMRRLIREERGNFGRALLDLCCGGGALAPVYEGPGKVYVGIDANPDMIRAARRSARDRGSSATFRLADVRRARIDGTFDTVTLLGNSLPHLTTHVFLRLLQRLRDHLRSNARFIVEYRDTVQLFFDKQGHGSYTQHRAGHRFVSTTRGVDLQRGEIRVTVRGDRGGGSFAHSQAIWSPFVLEPLMASQSWKLVHRKPEPLWSGWRDVYRFEGAPGARP